MIDIDDINEIKKLDPKGVFESTELFVKQGLQIHEKLESWTPDPSLINIQNVVVAGMGGSNLGARVVLELFKDELKVPLYINTDYSLPGFVNSNTLVIASSYSGSTEESLACVEDAANKGAKILGFTTGGRLKDLLTEKGLPLIVFEPIHNPSCQPRLGTGYGVIGIIEIFRKLGLLDIDSEKIVIALQHTEESRTAVKDNAKIIARKLFDKEPLIFAADFLTGCAHVLRNQINETAKSFAAYNPIPELNHHLMEGLRNPVNKNFIVLTIDSDLYPPLIQKRMELTKEVVNKNSIEVISFKPEGDYKLTQALITLVFDGYLSIYMGFLYGQDPSLIPWVDYFKDKLAHKD